MSRSMLMVLVLVSGCAARTTPSLGSARPDDLWCAPPRIVDHPPPGPAEYLLREHGLYQRLMLIYEESAGRLERAQPLSEQIVPSAAKMVQRYEEEFHQRLEEQLVFSRFEKAIERLDLVHALRGEHETGRAITNDILLLAAAEPTDAVERGRVAERLRAYVMLMRPHLVREDTELFPVLRKLVTADEARALGALFEQRERDQFGERGYEHLLADVEVLEKKLASSRSE